MFFGSPEHLTVLRYEVLSPQRRYATSHNLPPNNGIYYARKYRFHTRIKKKKKKKKSPYRGRWTPPPPHRPLPRFGPPLTNSGCTTVTGGIEGAQVQKRPYAPSSVDWSERNKKKGGGNGIYEEFHRKTRYIHFGQFEIFEI